MGRVDHFPDVFAEAKARYRVPDMWQMLGLPGEPRRQCKSPLRDDHIPSFSIFDDGRAWKDWGTGEGGDIIELARCATGWTHAEIRSWLMERMCIDFPECSGSVSLKGLEPAKRTLESPKIIDWPCRLVTGTKETWKSFAKLRGLHPRSVERMVKLELLRFGTVEGLECYIVMDESQRAAEIRRVDGNPFPRGGRKAYPLKGVDKSWLVGAFLIYDSPPEIPWVITEGASDYLHIFSLYCEYLSDGFRNHEDRREFIPMAMLGAGIKHFCPEIMRAARGRSIIIIPDGDEAGDKMGEHWSVEFSKAGADVDAIRLPRGRDLRDLHLAGEIEPEDLFNG